LWAAGGDPDDLFCGAWARGQNDDGAPALAAQSAAPSAAVAPPSFIDSEEIATWLSGVDASGPPVEQAPPEPAAPRPVPPAAQPAPHDGDAEPGADNGAAAAPEPVAAPARGSAVGPEQRVGPITAGVSSSGWDVETSSAEGDSEEEPLAAEPPSLSTGALALGDENFGVPVVAQSSAWDAATSSSGEDVEEVSQACALKEDAGDEVDRASRWMPPLPTEAQRKTNLTLQPVVMLGLEAWLKPMLALLKRARDGAGVWNREIKTLSLEFGAGEQFMALELLGAPYRVVGTCDKKQSARDWIRREFARRVDVCFSIPEEVMSMTGFDRIQQKFLEVMPTPIDCSMARWPVNAPSWRDRRRNSETDTYHALCAMWFKHLREAKPGSFYVEFDPQIQTAATIGGGTALDEWMKQARSCGYSLVSFTAPYALWVEHLPWSALVVVGFSMACGGSFAATWFRQAVQPVLVATKNAGPPCSIWDSPSDGAKAPMGLLDPNDMESLDDTETGSAASRS